MQDFRDLQVWQRAHALALDIYRLTREFPKEEIYGLVSQLRRAATSVASNIAEGSKRQSRNDFARFLNMAQGSLGEIESLLIFSRDLALVSSAQHASLDSSLQPLARMLSSLHRKVSSAARPGNTA